ncbi:MAG: hypothetical protein ABMA15_07775 [Vicinamibacterales bacterium]
MQLTSSDRARSTASLLLGLLVLLGAYSLYAQQPTPAAQGPTVLKEAESSDQMLSYSRGQAVIPAYEGWTPLSDGTIDLWFGYANVDFSLAKDWAAGSARRLEFRWEIFNLFNRANFDLPNRIFGNPNLGRIFSAKDPREMQFGLRLSF